MEPEKLKIIARRMGYEVELADSAGVWVYPQHSTNNECGRGAYLYNPSTDAEQAYEIEEWLVENEYIITIGKFRSGLYSVDVTRALHECYMQTGKTRAEAVLSAIWGTIEVK